MTRLTRFLWLIARGVVMVAVLTVGYAAAGTAEQQKAKAEKAKEERQKQQKAEQVREEKARQQKVEEARKAKAKEAKEQQARQQKADRERQKAEGEQRSIQQLLGGGTDNSMYETDPAATVPQAIKDYLVASAMERGRRMDALRKEITALAQTVVAAAGTPVNPKSAERSLPDGRVNGFRTEGAKEQDLEKWKQQLRNAVDRSKDLQANNPPFYLALPEKAPATGMLGRLPPVRVQQTVSADTVIVERTYRATGAEGSGSISDEFLLTSVKPGDAVVGAVMTLPNVFRVTGSKTIPLASGLSVSAYVLESVELTPYLKRKPMPLRPGR